MGGSIYGPGNMSPLAEANFGMDAAAARSVLDAFAPADADATPKVARATGRDPRGAAPAS